MDSLISEVKLFVFYCFCHFFIELQNSKPLILNLLTILHGRLLKCILSIPLRLVQVAIGSIPANEAMSRSERNEFLLKRIKMFMWLPPPVTPEMLPQPTGHLPTTWDNIRCSNCARRGINKDFYSILGGEGHKLHFTCFIA